MLYAPARGVIVLNALARGAMVLNAPNPTVWTILLCVHSMFCDETRATATATARARATHSETVASVAQKVLCLHVFALCSQSMFCDETRATATARPRPLTRRTGRVRRAEGIVFAQHLSPHEAHGPSCSELSRLQNRLFQGEPRRASRRTAFR